MNSLFVAAPGIPNIIAQIFPNLPNFIAHVLATIIIVVLLSTLVYKPYKGFVANRNKKINELLDDAVEKQTQATIDEKRAQAVLNEAKNESLVIIKNARIDAEVQRKQILTSAGMEANNLQAQAKNAIERSRIDAEEQIKENIVNVAFQVAEKLIDQNLDNEANQALVNQFIKELDN